MKSLVDYVHNLGLKMGLYTCIGTQTCRDGRPGSYGHYQQDANTLASWGIDFVKADNCNRPANESGPDLYQQFSNALNATGRQFVFSICNWGDDNVLTWGGNVGHMFRFQMDHIPFWRFPPLAAGQGYGQGTSDIIEYMATLYPANITKAYGFMDPDFLETLFPALAPVHTMTYIDSRTEYAFWTLWSAPLMVATDVRMMNDEMSSIIANPEVIAIDQDELFYAGERIHNDTLGGQIWAKKLQNGDQAVIFYNSHDLNNATLVLTWQQLGWSANAKVAVRDLWYRTDMGVFQGNYKATVEPHDNFYFRASLQS